jgi:hypothetical protein
MQIPLAEVATTNIVGVGVGARREQPEARAAGGDGIVSVASAGRISDDSSAQTTTLASRKIRVTTRISRLLLTWLMCCSERETAKVAPISTAVRRQAGFAAQLNLAGGV